MHNRLVIGTVQTIYIYIAKARPKISQLSENQGFNVNVIDNIAIVTGQHGEHTRGTRKKPGDFMSGRGFALVQGRRRVPSELPDG